MERTETCKLSELIQQTILTMTAGSQALNLLPVDCNQVVRAAQASNNLAGVSVIV